MKNPSSTPMSDEQSDELREWLVAYIDEESADEIMERVRPYVAHHTKEAVEAARREIIDKMSSADFVYEVMNAPTNGAARGWVKAELAAAEQKGKS